MNEDVLEEAIELAKNEEGKLSDILKIKTDLVFENSNYL